MAPLAEDDQQTHADLHALILPSGDLSMEKQSALSKLQAKFRGQRDRETHISHGASAQRGCLWNFTLATLIPFRMNSQGGSPGLPIHEDSTTSGAVDDRTIQSWRRRCGVRPGMR